VVAVTALGEYGPTRFLFGEQVTPYGEFLQKADITSVPFYVVDAKHAQKQESHFSRAFAVYCLLDRSPLFGDDNDLRDDDGRVGGVRSYAREAGAAESSIGNEGSRLEGMLKALKPGETFEHEGAVYARLAKR